MEDRCDAKLETTLFVLALHLFNAVYLFHFYLSLHISQFITAQTHFITAQIGYHCTLKLGMTRNQAKVCRLRNGLLYTFTHKDAGLFSLPFASVKLLNNGQHTRLLNPLTATVIIA